MLMIKDECMHMNYGHRLDESCMRYGKFWGMTPTLQVSFESIAKISKINQIARSSQTSEKRTSTNHSVN